MNLVFEVFSGGTIKFDLEKCEDCKSKACVKFCESPNMGDVLMLSDGLPSLKKNADEVKKGACTECLGCELECILHGNNAITITLPVKNLDGSMLKF